jgi:hypothetical protein
MTRVIVPLAKPAIAAVALFNFLFAWNDFFAPLLFVGNNPKLYTLASGWRSSNRVSGAVEPHDGGVGSDDAADHHPVLPGPEGVREGVHLDGVKG